MLERIEELPAGIEGVRARGEVSREDYERVFEPIIDQAREQGRHVRLLYELGAGFDGFTTGAAWEDAKLGLSSIRVLDACAVVTDVEWIDKAVRMVGLLLPFPMRVFPTDQREEAVAWLGSFPEPSSMTHRLLPDAGVIVVEPHGRLRAQDFDALAATADAWIEAHDHLAGLVIHTRDFPGWESFGSLLRHVRFVREHHRKLERVALAADTKLASLVPRIAEHFVKARIESFAYDQLDAAIAWASTGSRPSS